MLKYENFIVDFDKRLNHSSTFDPFQIRIMYAESLMLSLKGQMECIAIIRNMLFKKRLNGEIVICQWRVGALIDMEESILVSFL